MARSKHHKKNVSDSEWNKRKNKRKFNAKRVEAEGHLQDKIAKLHERRYRNPLTSPVVTKQSFTQKILARLGLNKSRRGNM